MIDSIKCKGCGKLIKDRSWRQRKYCSHACYSINRPNLSEHMEMMRKKIPVRSKRGSQEYDNLHKWVRKNKGKPQICTSCGLTREDRQIEWANVNHLYKWNLDDWISLCGSCHKKFDLGNPPTGDMFERIGHHFTKRKTKGSGSLKK